MNSNSSNKSTCQAQNIPSLSAQAPPFPTLVHKEEISTPQKSANPRESKASGSSKFGNIPANPRRSTVSTAPEIAQTRKGRRFPDKGDPEKWPITLGEIEEREQFRKQGVLKEWAKLWQCGKNTVPFKCESCGLRPWVKILCGPAKGDVPQVYETERAQRQKEAQVPDIDNGEHGSFSFLCEI